MPSQPISEFQFGELLIETEKSKNRFIAKRDSLFYEILYYLGLRPMECRCIELNHINFNEHTIFIPAENNKERQSDTINIPDFLWVKIIRYLNEREIESKWLFPSCLYSQRKKDYCVCYKQTERTFDNRMRRLGYLHISFIDRNKKPRYNLNLYSFRKRFGTFVYRKTRDPQTTALMLRQYDKQLKSVWRYVFAVQKEDRKDIINHLYS